MRMSKLAILVPTSCDLLGVIALVWYTFGFLWYMDCIVCWYAFGFLWYTDCVKPNNGTRTFLPYMVGTD